MALADCAGICPLDPSTAVPGVTVLSCTIAIAITGVRADSGTLVVGWT